MRALLIRFWLLLALSLWLAGCTKPAAIVSGKVTYEGKPVKDGMITFFPADGKGVAAAAKIRHGAYVVKNVVPGPKIVQIVSMSPAAVPSRDEMLTEYDTRKQTGMGETARVPQTAEDIIPLDAVGNNQPVGVTLDTRSLNFALKKPPAKSKK